MKVPLLTTLAFFSLVQLAAAQDDDSGVFNLVLENDFFGGTDKHYTSGILLNYATSRKGTPDILRRLAHGLPGIDSKDEIYTGLHVGHQIFTPDDTRTSDLLPEERPYAGYLFGGFSLFAANARELDSWKFSIGVVGPSARAREFHTSFHNRIGANVAQGWHHQLGDETIVQFDYQKTWRAFWRYGSNGVAADLMPYTGLGLGNAAVHIDGGVTLRWGQGLGNDFGPPRIRPSLPGSIFFDSRDGRGWYFFAGVGGRYVAHNIFLDGNTNQASHSVDKFNWVGDIQFGFVLNSHSYRLAYTYIARTREYRTQDEGDQFGSLTFSLRF